MATTTAGIVVAEPVHEVPHWLKTLPIAPEFHPTLAEFEDPISYILKIEKEASKYGICKIVPPVALPTKKTTIANLNRSLAARNPTSNPNPKSPPTFTTRYQQIGFDPRKGRPVQKAVWQSGEYYTVQQFEAKAKQFEKIHLKKCFKKGGYSPLEIETLFWRASVDKPFTVEYANDMPGSAFVPVKSRILREAGDSATVGETDWNMRGVARSKGSLLRFMKEEIPGVTSPMVYIAMLFSWFAWHVEDHDLHSLNYMHMGASKTWYGVPKDAGFAFQDVIRVHGYGGDFNPLVTFATLGEKTTVMSPEVLIGAGIPCCRLVQNVGEFVVTFPGAYHSGFSHGFNCAEASNIATPEWLRFAKEAAIRRASINCPPMVSHFQLLYALALALCSRVPMSISNEPRSSRLKDKKRGEGEGMVKEFFVHSVIQNNDLLHVLSSNGPCVLLPHNSSEISVSLNRNISTQKKVKRMMSLGLCNDSEAPEASKNLLPNEKSERNVRFRHLIGQDAVSATSNSVFVEDSVAASSIKHSHHGQVDLSNSMLFNPDIKSNSTPQDVALLEKGWFPCVQCGILSFACAAVVEPREAVVQYFMSADCSFLNDWRTGSGVLMGGSIVATQNEQTSEPNYTSGENGSSYQGDLYDVPVQSGDYEVQVSDEKLDLVLPTGTQKVISSLDLLASAYGNSSDSEEERLEGEMVLSDDINGNQNVSGGANASLPESNLHDNSRLHEVDPSGNISHSSSKAGLATEVSLQTSQCASYSRRKRKWTSSDVENKCHEILNCPLVSDLETKIPSKMKRLKDMSTDKAIPSGRINTGSAEIHETDLYTNQVESGPADSIMSSTSFCARPKFSQAEATKYSNVDVPIQNTAMSLMQIPNWESSKKHIFCLEHAVEIEKQLRPIGGVNILLLCHPEYPKVEEEAKLLAQDMGIDYLWKDIAFREATKEDQERIGSALDDESTDPSNGDWAVKLGINLYYSVHLSKSPLYTKQMPYNSTIYKVFGCSSSYPMEVKISGRVPSKQKKIVVAGKWCGKVWMSNQVHPYLAQRETEEDDSMMSPTQAVPCLKPSSKHERKVETSRPIEEPVISEERSPPRVTTNLARKPGKKKRKRKFVKAATKKEKLPELESESQMAEYSSGSDSSPSGNGNIFGNSQIKCERRSLQHSSVKNNKYDTNVKAKIESRPRKLAEKRKVPKEAAKKPQPPQLESPAQTEEDSSESESSSRSSGSFLQNGQNTHERQVLQRCNSNSKAESEGGPSTRLRRRLSKPVEEKEKSKQPVEEKEKSKPVVLKQTRIKKMKKALSNGNDMNNEEAEYHCDMDGCTMGFSSKQELVLHKRNICAVKGCGKKFFSHKYLVQHRRVHIDDRPLKCPWKGCKMTFKWAWARTEHIRVHTGDRPYVCREKGCGQTFRFVSDFSRHKRKTGHSVKGKG